MSHTREIWESMSDMGRIWVVALASMAALVIAVFAIGAFAVPTRTDDLWVEGAKAAIQLVVVIGLGGVVSFVFRTVEVSRERRRILDERRFAIFQQLVTVYHQLKFVRRNLRMVGLRGGPDGLLPEQVEALRSGMETVVDVGLTLEQISRELDAQSVFDRSEEINRELGRLLQYVDNLVEEWEGRGRAVLARSTDRSGAGSGGSAALSWPREGRLPSKCRLADGVWWSGPFGRTKLMAGSHSTRRGVGGNRTGDRSG